MNLPLRQTVSVILTLFILYLAYYGSFLPFRKAQKYIATRETPVNSLKEFDEFYDGLLGYHSPVGQDEIVSAYLEILTILINREGDKRREGGSPDEQLVRHLVGKAEQWAEPVIEKGAGFGFSQIILNFATVYRSATIALQDEGYYQKAVELYALGLKYSPNRAAFLYNLFDVYRFGGDSENAQKIGERIVEVYGDEKVKQIIGN